MTVCVVHSPSLAVHSALLSGSFAYKRASVAVVRARAAPCFAPPNTVVAQCHDFNHIKSGRIAGGNEDKEGVGLINDLKE